MTENESSNNESTHRSINVQSLQEVHGLKGAVVAIDLGEVADTQKPTITYSESNAHTGMAAWWAKNAESLTPQVLVRHREELENKFSNHEAGRTILSDSDRMEIAESIKVINAQLDEMLPHAPADLERHDRLNGNRVLKNWPLTASKSSRLIHSHFCELLDAWRINGMRQAASVAVIDEIAETQGISAFTFDVESDLHAFINHYQLGDFVTRIAPYEAGVSHDNVKAVWYLILTNKFTHEQVSPFLDEYKRAINSLSVIYDERRRAAHMDSGRIGFTMIDHFVSREVIELNRIRIARKTLSEGYIRSNG